MSKYIADEVETEYKGFYYWTFGGDYYIRDEKRIFINTNTKESVLEFIDMTIENDSLRARVSELEMDSERLYKSLCWGSESTKFDWECGLCHEEAFLHGLEWECNHAPDCPVTLHEKLMKRVIR